MPEVLLTAQQVAAYLKVDKFTVYRLVAQRKLPAFRVGSQWRFKRSSLESWLRKNMNTNLPSNHKSQ
jgi:excisionase family DNA binding protein